MKKIIIATAFVMGAGVSSSAMAAAGPWSSAPLSVTTTDCLLLAEDVVLNVSSRVHGHYTCDETSSEIRVGACHEGGSRATGVACAYVDLNDPTTPLDPTDDTLNSAGCTAQMVTDGDNSTIPNYNAFTATSAGGSMTEQELTGRCVGTSLTGLAFW